MQITAQSLIDRFPELIKHISGPSERPIAGPSSVDSRIPNSVVFGNRLEDAELLADSRIAVLVMIDKVATKLATRSFPFTLLASSNPRLTMAKVLDAFFQPPDLNKAFGKETIHPTAVVHPTAEIGKNVVIGPYAVISRGCKIADQCFIGAQSVLEPFVTLGEGTCIYPQVYIGSHCQLGKFCRIHPHTSIGSEGYGFAQDADGTHVRIPHHGRVILGDHVRVGAGFCIDRGTLDDTTVGDGTKIDNHGHIAHNGKIGRHGLLTAGIIMAGSVKIGDRFTCAGRTGINNKVTITDNVILGAQSTVVSNIEKPGHYSGYPLLELKDSLRAIASTAQLPRMRKLLAKIAKHLKIEE